MRSFNKYILGTAIAFISFSSATAYAAPISLIPGATSSSSSSSSVFRPNSDDITVTNDEWATGNEGNAVSRQSTLLSASSGRISSYQQQWQNSLSEILDTGGLFGDIAGALGGFDLGDLGDLGDISDLGDIDIEGAWDSASEEITTAINDFDVDAALSDAGTSIIGAASDYAEGALSDTISGSEALTIVNSLATGDINDFDVNAALSDAGTNLVGGASDFAEGALSDTISGSETLTIVDGLATGDITSRSTGDTVEAVTALIQ